MKRENQLRKWAGFLFYKLLIIHKNEILLTVLQRIFSKFATVI